METLLQIIALEVGYEKTGILNKPVWHFDNCLRSLRFSHYEDTYSKYLSFVAPLTEEQQKYIETNILNESHLLSFLELSIRGKVDFLGITDPKILSLLNGEFDDVGFMMALSSLSENQILNALNKEQLLEDEWREIEHQNQIDEQERQWYENEIEAAKFQAADLFEKYAHLETY